MPGRPTDAERAFRIGRWCYQHDEFTRYSRRSEPELFAAWLRGYRSAHEHATEERCSPTPTAV